MGKKKRILTSIIVIVIILGMIATTAVTALAKDNKYVLTVKINFVKPDDWKCVSAKAAEGIAWDILGDYDGISESSRLINEGDIYSISVTTMNEWGLHFIFVNDCNWDMGQTSDFDFVYNFKPGSYEYTLTYEDVESFKGKEVNEKDLEKYRVDKSIEYEDGDEQRKDDNVNIEIDSKSETMMTSDNNKSDNNKSDINNKVNSNINETNDNASVENSSDNNISNNKINSDEKNDNKEIVEIKDEKIPVTDSIEKQTIEEKEVADKDSKIDNNKNTETKKFLPTTGDNSYVTIAAIVLCVIVVISVITFIAKKKR